MASMTPTLPDADTAGYVTFGVIPMAILIFPADKCFVYLNNTHKLAKVGIVHRGTQSDGTYTKPCGNRHNQFVAESGAH